MRSLFLLTFATLFFTACTQERPKLEELRSELKSIQEQARVTTQAEEKNKLAEKTLSLMDKASPKDDDIDPFVEAEALAAEAEALFALDAFQEGLAIFESVLEMDAGNERANAYLAILKPLWEMRGFYWRTGNTDQVDYSVLLFPGLKKDLETKMTWFFLLPTPELPLVRSIRDMQKLIATPWSKAIISANRHWEILKTNRDLDITLTLPQVFIGQEQLRIRWEDSIAAYNLYLASSVYFRLASSYSGSLDPTYERHEPGQPQRFDNRTALDKLMENLADPEFGALTDPDLFTQLKGKFLEFSQGLSQLVPLLTTRLAMNQNSPDDLVQFSTKNYQQCSWF